MKFISGMRACDCDNRFRPRIAYDETNRKFSVSCRNCGIKTEQHSKKDMAISAWNIGIVKSAEAVK